VEEEDEKEEGCWEEDEDEDEDEKGLKEVIEEKWVVWCVCSTRAF
jgi:hypothetical protein